MTTLNQRIVFSTLASIALLFSTALAVAATPVVDWSTHCPENRANA